MSAVSVEVGHHVLLSSKTLFIRRAPGVFKLGLNKHAALFQSSL